MRSHEVIAGGELMLEELCRHDRTHRVRTQIVGTGGAASVPIEAGERITATFCEWAAKDIPCFCHGPSLPGGYVRATTSRSGNNGQMPSRSVQVPAHRLDRWISGFAERHGGSSITWADGTLTLTGEDGSTATFRPPYPAQIDTVDGLIARISAVPRTAVIAVRRGGFLAAVVDGSTVVAGDAGKRHVQGRTSAGGWSQQRFARRRDKQVHELSQAAADYAARVIVPELPAAYLATGGDRPLVDDVLDDPRLRPLRSLPRGPHLSLNDIRKATIDELPGLLSTCRIDLVDP